MPISLVTKNTLLELAEIMSKELSNFDCCSSKLSIGLLVRSGIIREHVVLPEKIHSVSLLSVPADELSHVISGGFELRNSILIWWSFSPGNLRYLIFWVCLLIDLRLFMLHPRFVTRNIRVSK